MTERRINLWLPILLIVGLAAGGGVTAFYYESERVAPLEKWVEAEHNWGQAWKDAATDLSYKVDPSEWSGVSGWTSPVYKVLNKELRDGICYVAIERPNGDVEIVEAIAVDCLP